MVSRAPWSWFGARWIDEGFPLSAGHSPAPMSAIPLAVSPAMAQSVLTSPPAVVAVVVAVVVMVPVVAVVAPMMPAVPVASSMV
jgi:hypothetical protein